MMAEAVLDSGNPLATPEQTHLQERDAESDARFRASERPCSPPRRSFQNTSHVIPNFKPVNLPKFDRRSNVTMFLRLYGNTMYGTDNAMKNSAIFNCLDAET